MLSFRSVGLLVALGCATAACGEDKDDEAALATSGFVVESGYITLQPIDGCDLSEISPTCETEKLVRVTDVEVEDPSIVEVFGPGEAPREVLTGLGRDDALIVHGKKVGRTTVRVTAEFDDGSVRSASEEIDVRRVDRIELDLHCSGEPDLLQLGERADFSLGLYSKGAYFIGYVAEPISADCLEGTDCTPTETGSFTVTSRLLPSFSKKYRVFSPDDVELAWEDSYTSWGDPGDFIIHTRATVNGEVPCDAVAIQATGLSPDICQVDEESVRQRYGSVELAALASGVCSVSVSAAGSSNTTSLERTLFLTEESPTLVQSDSQACDVEGEVTCRGNVYHCKDGIWQSKESCGPRTECRVWPTGADGCTSESGWCADCVAQVK